MTRLPEARTQVAAFFDVDGTILARPSLERRFFAMLRYQRAIPARNYLLWVAQAIRLAPRGFAPIAHANKMYLRGVRADAFFSGGGTTDPETPTLRRCSSLAPLRDFFPPAMERIAWHAAQEHAVVLVTGTLAPLAHEVALALVLRLAVRGPIGVARSAQPLARKWTGVEPAEPKPFGAMLLEQHFKRLVGVDHLLGLVAFEAA